MDFNHLVDRDFRLPPSLDGTISTGTRKSAPSSVHSSLSWNTEQDYDHSITEANKKLMENVMGFLFQENMEPLADESILMECKNWARSFNHLRIRGCQKFESKDIGYEIINLYQNSRPRSPYLFIPAVKPRDESLYTFGLALNPLCFQSDSKCDSNSSSTYIVKYSDDKKDPNECISEATKEFPWLDTDLEEALRQFCDRDGNGVSIKTKDISERDCQTPVPGPNHSRSQISVTVQGRDTNGFDGLHKFSQDKHINDLEYSIYMIHYKTAILVSLRDKKSDLDDEASFLSVPHLFKIEDLPKLNSILDDMECIFIDSPLRVLRLPSDVALHDFDFDDFIQSSLEDFIDIEDGNLEELLAFDEGHDEDHDAVYQSRKEKREQEKISPRESIKDDVFALLFEDFWTEVPPLLAPLVARLGFRKSKGSSVGSMTPTAKREADESTILDSMPIEDIIKNTPNLLSAMTIRPVPLQRREPSRIKSNAQDHSFDILSRHSSAFEHQDVFSASRPVSARKNLSLIHKPPLNTSRPLSARHPDPFPPFRLHTSVGLRPSPLGNSLKNLKSGVPNRLLPLPQNQISNLANGLCGISIGYKPPSNSYLWDSKVQPTRKLPPIKSLLSDESLQESKSKVVRHVAFDPAVTEQLRSHVRTPLPGSPRKKLSSAGPKRQALSRPHTALGDIRTSFGSPPKQITKDSSKDDNLLHPVLGMKAFVTRGYKKRNL